MKKFTILASLFVSLFAAKNSSAQYTLDKDTSKGYWGGSGYVETKIKATNTGSSPLVLDWRMSALSLAPGWNLSSACEPSGYCYSGTQPGLKDGTKTFTTDPIASSGNFLVDFDCDAAALNTMSYAVLEVSASGGAVKKIAFVGYKNPTGVSTFTHTDEDISIFPNPATSYIDVLYSPSSDVKTISIYNLIGKVVSVYKVTDKNSARCEFNTDMASGIYLVRVADSKGNVIATRKITHQ